MRGRMPLSAILLFACVVASLFFTRAGIVPHHERAVPRPPRMPQVAEPPGIPSLPGPPGGRYDAAERMAAQGQLRAAQDEYLRILLMNPNDTRAMQGLIAVERRTANDDAAVLRHRAEAYRRTLGGGAAPQGYVMDLQLLYVANLMAAAQADAERMAKTGAPGSGTSAGRRIERAPAQSPVMLPGAKNPTVAMPAAPGISATGSRAAPAQAIPQQRPYHAPATVPLPRPAPSPGGPGAPTVPAQTVALEQPLPERSAGTLRTVDCRTTTFGIEDGGSWRNFAATSRTVIYAGTERLGQFCTLKGFVGSQVLVWGTRVGPRRTAERVSVAAVSASVMSAPKGGQEGTAGRDALRPPPSSISASWNGTSDPVGRSSSAGYAGETERIGIITTKVSNAALVVSRDGALPIVIAPSTRVIGLRTAFGAISRFDVVRVHGRSTSSGTLIADIIEVTQIPSRHQLQQLGLDSTYPSASGMPQWVGAVGIAAITGQLAGRGVEAGSLGGAAVSAGGASVTGGGGTSVNAGGASIGGGSGAAVNAGGTSVSGGGGASVNAGGTSASAGGGASVNAGGASVSGGGGASVNAGGASVSAGGSAAVNAGGASVKGGASVSAAGASVGIGSGASPGGGGGPDLSGNGKH